MSVKRESPAERKALPIASGVLDYFPDALLAVAEVSRVGNEQHNPGQPMHWAKEKSTDEADALLRHLIDRGKLDSDGLRHTAKVAWRALALLQRELDAEAGVSATPIEAAYIDAPMYVPDWLCIPEKCCAAPGAAPHADTCRWCAKHGGTMLESSVSYFHTGEDGDVWYHIVNRGEDGYQWEPVPTYES